MNITNTVSWKNLHIDLERLNGVHLNDLFSKDTADYKNDRNVMYGSETPTSTETEANLKTRTVTEIDKGFARLEKNFTDLTSKIDNLKAILEKDPKSLKRIQLDIESTTSFVAPTRQE